MEALLGLAEQLGDLSSKMRAKGLQEGLERINEFFLSDQAQGSDLIYVPFGGGFHQAWRCLVIIGVLILHICSRKKVGSTAVYTVYTST